MPAHRSIPAHLHLAETPLPDPDLALAVHAHDLVELGAWLLAASDAALLTVILSPLDRDRSRPVTLWDGRLLRDAERTAAIAVPGYRFRSVVKAVEQAADDLFASLRPRWPGATPPPGLGVVSDGSGLGFCPDDPWPLAPGWMARQVRDPARLTCLLPFAPGGAWSTLTRSAA